MRAIAAQAGVDSALIRHFFHDKETLFATTMADRTEIPARMMAAFAGPPETLGLRATSTYLKLWEDEETRPIFLGLLRSAMTSQHGIELLLEVVGGRLRESSPLPTMDRPRAERIALAATHLLGVAIARNVLRMPIIAEMSHDQLVNELAPLIQRCLTDDPPGSRT